MRDASKGSPFRCDIRQFCNHLEENSTFHRLVGYDCTYQICSIVAFQLQPELSFLEDVCIQ